jgi:hypothetical protein
MFGLNNSNSGGIPASTDPSAGPMVPNGDGIDEPVKAPPSPPMPLSSTPSAPPMPAGPASGLSAVEDQLPLNSSPAKVAPTPPTSAPATSPLNPQVDDDLIKLKQAALQNLAPLVDHLDQTPEEKFKTTMMMLQASDNPELVKEAYAAANAISDEKIRAQALLDVVNEINYFTQHTANNNQQKLD